MAVFCKLVDANHMKQGGVHNKAKIWSD